MIFFFKPKVIHLDCFTIWNEVYVNYPITHSNEFHENGLTIVLWSDLSLKCTDKQVVGNFFGGNSDLSSHPFKQMNGYLNPKKYFHMKIRSAWAFECKDDINFIWMQNTQSFARPDEIIIPPAIIDYKYQSGTHINFFGKYAENDQEKNILIKAGKPIVNIIPLSEKNLKIHNHLVDENKFKKVISKNYSFKFYGQYNIKKKIIRSREKKCPFLF